MKQQPVRSARQQSSSPSASGTRAGSLPNARAKGPTSWWTSLVRIPAPDQSSPRWHVSPVIDMAAYHFSWVWLLIPMLLAGPDRYQDYLGLFALVMAFNFTHRHFGLPYAYLDGDVFRTHQQKLTWFPLACVIMLVATPFLLTRRAVSWWGVSFVSAIVFFSLVWNFWHVYMQKYGILRLYMAKDPGPAERKTPGWVDRLLIFCWFPLYFSYLAPKHRQLISDNANDIKAYTTVVVDFMTRYETLLVVPSVLIVVTAAGLWLWHDWRAHAFKNRARLSAAGGTFLLSSALLWADPIKVYVAYGFSHAIEYMVFVWAYQRRAYRVRKDPPTVMQRLLQRPISWYIAFSAVLLTVGALSTVYGRTLLADLDLLGLPATRWLFYYAVYESLIHFYTDGFLWKMRKAQVRANI